MIVDKAVYREGQRQPCGDPSSELTQLRAGGEGFLWIGLKDPTDAEFAAVNDQLQLNPLAVEGVLEGNRRPSIDVDLETSAISVFLKTFRYIDETSDVETGELMMFVGDQFVLTVRKGDANPLADLRHEIEEDPERLAIGPIAVMYGVFDLMVDSYAAVDVELSQDLDAIEEKVFAGPRAANSTEIYKLKREVLEFKRGSVPLVLPLRKLVMGDERVVVPKKLRPFFRDVLQHLLQVVEHAESYDRLLTDALSAHLSQLSVQQNDDMRKISAWVAMAAVPTMVAGIYGMNFDNMPELHWHYGYFIVLGLMVATVASLYVMFRRSHWL